MEEFDESRQKTGESHFESGVTLWLYVRQPGRVLKKTKCQAVWKFSQFFLLASLINQRECFGFETLFRNLEPTWARLSTDLDIGESLFTLFASLTYAYHYLMTLIK